MDCGFLAGVGLALAQAQAQAVPTLNPQAKFDLQGELTFIGQSISQFRSPYAGANSFPSRGTVNSTETGTAYAGLRPVPNVEVYVNPEFALGTGAGNGSGLGGYSNGDLIGQPAYPDVLYVARAFARWRIPVRQGKDQPVNTESVGRAPNIIAGPVPQHRLVVQAGKFAPTDVFDVNSYANNSRTQFLNNAFVNNLAYDYPEDARGYNFGLTAALMNPRYAVRFGAFAMPTSPGSTGVQYADDAHSEQLEVDFNPVVFKSYKTPAVVRLSVFRNQGFMGTYSDALAGSTPPTLSSVRVPGLVRYGFGVNCEQALSDDGTTGLFARLGVADGSIESDAYAEADSALSFGIQIGGSHWKRKDDVAGLALGFSGVSDVHQRYLNTGGLGLTLGDSALRYGAESVLEAYYLRQLTKSLSVTLDFQCVSNPGYNRDRGPAPILSLRVRYAF